MIGETLRRATPNRDLERSRIPGRAGTAALGPQTSIPRPSMPASLPIPCRSGSNPPSACGAKSETGRLSPRSYRESIAGTGGRGRSRGADRRTPRIDVPRRSRATLLGGYAFAASRDAVSRLRVSNSPVRQPRRYGLRDRRAGRRPLRHRSGPAVRAGRSGRVLLPLVFCRECGQEYYSVRMMTDDAEPGRRRLHAAGRRPIYRPRRAKRPAYLHVSAAEPWPTDPAERDCASSRTTGSKSTRAPSACGPAGGRSCLRPIRVGPDADRSGGRVRLPFSARAVSLLPALRRLVRLPAAFRFRQAGDAQLRRAKHGDDDSFARRPFESCAASRPCPSGHASC